MKSWYLHYKNKYPGGQVKLSDSGLDVYSASGEHVICIQKDGSGQMKDMSSEYGLRDRHDLAPIPKDARVHKLVDGKIGFDEKSEERKKLASAFVCPEKKDVVLSCADLKKHGFEFDEKQKEISK